MIICCAFGVLSEVHIAHGKRSKKQSQRSVSMTQHPLSFGFFVALFLNLDITMMSTYPRYTRFSFSIFSSSNTTSQWCRRIGQVTFPLATNSIRPSLTIEKVPEEPSRQIRDRLLGEEIQQKTTRERSSPLSSARWGDFCSHMQGYTSPTMQDRVTYPTLTECVTLSRSCQVCRNGTRVSPRLLLSNRRLLSFLPI